MLIKAPSIPGISPFSEMSEFNDLYLLVSEPSSSPSFVGGCVIICVAFILLFLVISSLCFLHNFDIVYPLLLNYLSQI